MTMNLSARLIAARALTSQSRCGAASFSEWSETWNGESGSRACPMTKSLRTLSWSKSKVTNTRVRRFMSPPLSPSSASQGQRPRLLVVRRLQRRDRLQRAASDPLQAAVEPGEAADLEPELLLALVEEAVGRGPLGFELVEHCQGGADDVGHEVLDFLAADVLVEVVCDMGAVRVDEPCLRDLVDLLPEHGRERHHRREVADPDAAQEADVFEPVREGGGDDDGDVGLLCLLVAAELVDPAVAPVFVVLRFPEELAALAAAGAHPLDDIGAALA